MTSEVSRPSKGSRQVNNILQTLRGEHFRRTLNAQRAPRLGPRAAALSTHTPVGRSLPYAEIYGLQPRRSSSLALGVDVKATRTTAAGPIPRSWAASATVPAPPIKVSAAWRAKALSLFFTQTDDGDRASTTAEGPSGTGRRRRATVLPGSSNPCPRPPLVCPPSLAECCLRVLLQHCASGATGGPASSESESSFLEELASYLAPHHRRLAVRLCAVQGPALSAASLRAFWGVGEGEGNNNHVEGELVVVEPAWSVRPELFRARSIHHTQVEHGHEGTERERAGLDTLGEWDVADPGDTGDSGSTTDARPSWQDQDEDEQQPLTAIAIMSTTLSIPTVLALPPSLTHLALVHLAAPIPVHRLPDKCPLLEFLDISYNPWLAEPAWSGKRVLEMVTWGRWAYLKVLGCRDCDITSDELRKVNEGRWEDVTIVT